MNAYQEFKIIGSRPIRPDGLDKVTGRAPERAAPKKTRPHEGEGVRSPNPPSRIS